MKTKPPVLMLAFASLFFAMLLPPEAYPNGKLAVVLCATFAFVSALSERLIPQKYLNAGMWIFAVLLIHTFVVSVDLYRSLDMLASLWAYYCLIGFFMYAGAGYEKQLAVVMVALSLIVSGYGLYQYFWGFDKIHQLIFYAASDQVVKAPALDVVATRRVFSTVALPGTLWGFLVCALPFHAMLWRGGTVRLSGGREGTQVPERCTELDRTVGPTLREWRRRFALDVVLVVSAGMLLATGFLTRSFGFLLGLFVLIVGAVWMRNRRMVWNRLTPVVVMLAIVAGFFYSARHGVIEGANPAGLRFLNWVTAWNIFAVHPLGAGLNTFGVVYPEYMQPSANETQYVHNTFLQLLSELGYPLIVTVIVIVIAKANSLKNVVQSNRRETFWLILAVSVWVTHNMVDIDVYFPSVGVVGAVLIGVLLAREHGEFPPLSKLSVAIVGVFAAVVVVFSGAACISTELQHRAQIEYENKKLTTAAETLSTARRICPINSSIDHDAGEILLALYQTTREPHYLDQAAEAFRTAVRLSPEKAGSHIGYSLSLSAAGRISEAMDEIRIAQTLYPSSSYVQAIARLIGQRLQ